MNKAMAIAVCACVLVLASCASKPVITGDSTIQQKAVSYPAQGQQVHAVVGGMVHIKANYQSRYYYKLTNPLTMGFMLGKVIVSTDEGLSQAILDGEEVFCTRTNVYFDPITGPHKKACFQSAEKGYFNNIKVAPGEVWFNKQLSPPIEYHSSEMGLSYIGKPLKRELVFDGGDRDTLLFTEKIYENSIETASRIKPLVVKVEPVPSKVTLDGAVLNVISYTNSSLTYTIEKPWE